MVLAVIVLVAAHAFAAPVNLICTGGSDFNKDWVARITFDENLGTAFFGDDPASRASFTATNIKWSGFYTKNDPVVFNLDRISGVLFINFSTGGSFNFNCVVAAEKKF
jgi:hypothetical protein